MAIVQPVIMAGGKGTRLWPLSRASRPKQFLPLVTKRSLVADAAALIAARGDARPSIVVTGEEYASLARAALLETGLRFDKIILESFCRSTAPVAAIASLLLTERAPDAIIVLLAADSFFSDRNEFNRCLDRAITIAKDGMLVLFGVGPTIASTQFGYIQCGAAFGDGAFFVTAFKEKPDAITASRFFTDGKYLWNAGNFVFRADAMVKELERFAPDVLASCKAALKGAREDGAFLYLDAKAMKQCRAISLDHAVMEKTERAAVVRLDCGWLDAGTWGGLWELTKKNGPDAMQQSIAAFVKKVHALAGGELVAEKVERPWGSYEILLRGNDYQIKYIEVRPGQAISLQYHHKRAEHWIVVCGAPRITIGTEARSYGVNETAFIDVGAVHRLENPTDEMAAIVEVQIGSYLGEDDIVRLEDRYNRV